MEKLPSDRKSIPEPKKFLPPYIGLCQVAHRLGGKLLSSNDLQFSITITSSDILAETDEIFFAWWRKSLVINRIFNQDDLGRPV